MAPFEVQFDGIGVCEEPFNLREPPNMKGKEENY